jgi:hypothetical protein
MRIGEVFDGAAHLPAALRGAALLGALALVPAAASWFVLREDPVIRLACARVPAIGAAEAAEGPVLWVDARWERTFEAGHIAGAVCFNEVNWEAQVGTLAFSWRPGMRVVVYGEPGDAQAARRTAAIARECVGLPDVAVLRGDWRALGARLGTEGRKP